MVKNRLVFSMVVIMLTMIIIGLAAVILHFNMTHGANKQSINDVVASSWETKEITANTMDDQFIRIQFQIQLDNKKAKKEIEKRDFQVYDIIYNMMTDMKAEEFLAEDSLVQFERTLINEINSILENGEVVKIYTVEKIIQ